MGTSLRDDMPQPGADWHQGRFPVREATHNPCPPAYLAVESFEDVVCPDVAPMLAGEVEIRQRFAHALGVHIRGRGFRGSHRRSRLWPPAPTRCSSFWFRLLTVNALTREPHRSSVTSFTRRTDTPARYISMSDSSTDDSLRP